MGASIGFMKFRKFHVPGSSRGSRIVLVGFNGFPGYFRDVLGSFWRALGSFKAFQGHQKVLRIL